MPLSPLSACLTTLAVSALGCGRRPSVKGPDGKPRVVAPSYYAAKWHGVPFPDALATIWYKTFQSWPLPACAVATKFLMAVGSASPEKKATAFVPPALINWVQSRACGEEPAPERPAKRPRVDKLIAMVKQLSPAQREAFDAALANDGGGSDSE